MGSLDDNTRSQAWPMIVEDYERVFNEKVPDQIRQYTPELFSKMQSAYGGQEEGPTVGQRDFTSMTKGFSPEDVVTSQRIKAGLDPRAVGSSAQTTALTPGLSDIVAESKANIEGKVKFAGMQGSQRSQVIDKSFEKVTKLEQNILNLDNAIDAVKAGAGTGAITKRFPSIRQSSVLLDQVQGALALDVIGSVTFGALSEGELNLAKAIAIPTGLEGPELIQWLLDKKTAQQKLLGYFKDQINHLDQGGSVASFLRSKGRGSAPPTVAESPAGQTQAPQQAIEYLKQNPQFGEAFKQKYGYLPEG
jgi:hypothetical protein